MVGTVLKASSKVTFLKAPYRQYYSHPYFIGKRMRLKGPEVAEMVAELGGLAPEPVPFSIKLRAS